MKIALCMPIHSGAKPAFVHSLVRMIDWTHRANLVADGKPAKPVIQPVMYTSSNVAASRSKIAVEALAWGADWLMWLDSDHSFPADTLTRLLGRGKPVVGANYRRRNLEEVKVTAYLAEEGRLVPTFSEAEGVEEVVYMGMGVCLTHAEVFRRIQPPYFQFGVREDGETVGEDVGFFNKVRAARIPIFVDHDLSREVGHIAETELRLPPG